jgi:hypothetical protein
MTLKSRLKRLGRLVPRQEGVTVADVLAVSERCKAEGREATPDEVAIQEQWLEQNGITESIAEIKEGARKARTHYEDLLAEKIAAIKPRLPNGLKVLPDE